MGWIEDIRNFASQNLVNRAIVYTAGTIVMAFVASILVSLLRLPMTPPYMILVAALLFIVMFYFMDPENEYTTEDFLALFIASVFLTVIMAWAAYASQMALIKQYAAPLVFMQEAAEGMATALNVPANDILGTALLNIWAWFGGLGIAMGIKQLITQRSL